MNQNVWVKGRIVKTHPHEDGMETVVIEDHPYIDFDYDKDDPNLVEDIFLDVDIDNLKDKKMSEYKYGDTVWVKATVIKRSPPREGYQTVLILEGDEETGDEITIDVIESDIRKDNV